MVARELIEDENVLSLRKIKRLFNHFYRENRGIIDDGSIGDWILHSQAKTRLFGITQTNFRALTGSAQNRARKVALGKFNDHFEAVFQRRHDCIHNCDRPKVSLQKITDVTVKKRIQDIAFLVGRCHESLVVEYPLYLSEHGFNSVTRNRVCI